ncbi:hypothetical protein [Treponema pedis]|uniref:Uncharacterized protein n=1 Tax=Treponema pedis TaxID=409322 RepID=A0A7S6WQZ1_9SPIR|nr:hypothetical protein [Treponema pedis]QOW61172.1 hypothetical protein IFE08_01830 [Treponema pedis]
MKILFKKELYEFRYNYKAWFIAFLSIAAVYAPTSWKHEAPVFLLCLWLLISIGQYIYESYYTETKHGGWIFIHNMGVTFFELFFAKFLCSLMMVIVIMIIDIPNLIGKIWISDFFLIFLFTIIQIEITYLSIIFSKGSEATSSTVGTILSVVLLFAAFYIQNAFLRIFLLAVLACFLGFVCKTVSKTLKYRTQL